MVLNDRNYLPGSAVGNLMKGSGPSASNGFLRWFVEEDFSQD
jgi:hypothetical protein